MSNNKIVSPFQILDWRVLGFSCTNPVVIIPADVKHDWTIMAHIDNLGAEADQLRAMIQIKFSVCVDCGSQKATMEGECVAMCTMNKQGVSDPDTLFQKLLKHNAMVTCLANLRVFLLQAGILHQMGPRHFMLPFINLNNFSFDEEIKFTT